jgi:hypothetical protein
MVEVDFSGNYLNAENSKPNDLGVFIDEGKFIDKSKGSKTWKQLSITVEVSQKQYIHSFRSAEGKKFQDAFGKDTKQWIGKKFKVTHIPYVKEDKSIGYNVELIPVQD